MEIIRHLSDDELAGLTLASDEQYLRETLAKLPACAQTASQQPDEFWQEQRVKVWSRDRRWLSGASPNASRC